MKINIGISEYNRLKDDAKKWKEFYETSNKQFFDLVIKAASNISELKDTLIAAKIELGSIASPDLLHRIDHVIAKFSPPPIKH